MSQLKVVQVVEDLEIGGAERVIETIALGLDSNLFKVEVWCLVKGGKVAESLAKRGIAVRILGLTSYYNPANIFKLAALIRHSRAMIIHSHGYYASTFARLAAILVRRLIIITHVHTTQYGMRLRNHLIDRLLSRITDKIICISQAVQDFVVNKEGINPDLTTIIYNGINLPPNTKDSSSQGNILKLIGLNSNHVVVIVVASLQPHKGHKVLIEAFAKIIKKAPHTRLIIIGEGPLKDSLSGLVSKKGLSMYIKFLGEQDNVYQYLSISDLFVLPSIEREGLGLALIEAMAMGLPVIGSDLGGIKELIAPGSNGRLFQPGNASELANEMYSIINDEAESKKMGLVGKKMHAKNFTGTKMVESISSLYHNLLNKTDAARSL